MKIVLAIVAIILLSSIVLGLVMLFDTATTGFALTDSYKWAIGIISVGFGLAALFMVFYLWWKSPNRRMLGSDNY